MADPNTGGLFDRLANLVELVTTLDVRVTNALEGLEEMRTSVTGLDPVREDVTELMADLRTRLDAWDERLNRDLDDIKNLAMEKLRDVDLNELNARFERMEASMRNVERSTTNMDHALSGSMDALPDFLSRRIKNEAAKRKTDHEQDPLTHDDLGH
jgi:hypothetical protein